jgi:putative ABC transport system permease protein
MSAQAPPRARRGRRLSVGGLVALYVVRVRRRWIQELLAILGIASGVALLYATQVASTSLSQPVKAIMKGLVGQSQLEVVGRGGALLPEDIYERLIVVPGVRHAAPVLQLPGNVVGPDGEAPVTIMGADPRIVRLRGSLLRGFTSAEAAQQEAVALPGPVARRIGIETGDDFRVQLAGRSIVQPAVVAGRRELGPLVGTSIALAPLSYLQRLGGTGHKVSLVLIEAAPGQLGAARSRLERALGGAAVVRPAKYESTLFDEAAKPTTQASTVFSLVSALVGWLFAVCALLITAGDRRKLAVQQREQGYPPSTTLATLTVDVLVVGLVGTLVGLAAGEILSRTGFSTDISYLSGAFPIGDERLVTWRSVALAAGGGMLAAALGILVPVRDFVLVRRPGRFRSMTTSPEPRPRALRQGVIGVACLAVAALSATAPSMVVVTLALIAAGLVLVLPVVVVGICAVIEWGNARLGSAASVELALQQLRARRWRARTLAIVTTGAVAVFGASTLEGARQNLKGGLTDVVEGLADASPVWTTARGAGDVYGTASFAPADLRRLRAASGIGAVELYRSGLLDVAGHRAWVLGVPRGAADPVPAHQLLEGDRRAATAALHRGGAVALSRAVADALHLGIGDVATLPTLHPRPLRVVGITTNLGWSSGAIVMAADDFVRAWGGGQTAAYFTRPADGVSEAQAATQTRKVLAADPALRVETAQQRVDRQLRAALAGLQRLQEIAQLTLLVAVLAMTVTMVALLWQHRAFAAALKVHGPRAGLIWRTLIVESAVLFMGGTLVGAAFALPGQLVATRGLEALTGFPVMQGVQVGTTAVAVGLVAGASLLSVLVPGYVVSRVRPTWRK